MVLHFLQCRSACSECVYIVLLSMTYECMERYSVTLTETPYFHAKVTPESHILWLQPVKELTASQEGYSNLYVMNDHM